jgi:hypothetical protein
MDILYYSNHCKHSQKLLQSLVKGGLSDKINFVNIDNRRRDPQTGQTYIFLENGSKVIMPPNIHSVPTLLIIKENYRVILGDEIIKYYHPQLINKQSQQTLSNGEPLAYQLNKSNGGTNIVSEQFTFFNLTPDELSAKGKGGNRQMYNYVTTDSAYQSINTPEDNYKADKVSSDVTVDKIQQQRIDEISTSQQQNKMFA